jgi:flagellar basal body-associated protein FliL
MKSKSTGFILIVVVLLVVAALVYFFVLKGKSTGTQSQPTGLVSTTTGTAQGIRTPVASTSSTGSQVVEVEDTTPQPSVFQRCTG